MADAEKQRIELARSAREEEIASLLHDASPNVVRVLLQNIHLTEDDVLVITTRKNLPTDILESIAKDKRWVKNYPISLALAKNPKTPLSIGLSIARYLRLFDLAEISRSRFLPIVFRRKLEAIIIEKIPTMELGIRKTLAKIVSGDVLLKLIQDSSPDVVTLCLNSPYLQESHLFKVISRRTTMPGTIRAIAEHKNWSCRAMIRRALVRNKHTPLALSVQFLAAMKIMDLRDLYADPSVSVTMRPFIHRELWERGEEPDKQEEEQVYEIDDEDESVIEQFKDVQEHP